MKLEKLSHKTTNFFWWFENRIYICSALLH